jgi:hypothetical protein
MRASVLRQVDLKSALFTSALFLLIAKDFLYRKKFLICSAKHFDQGSMTSPEFSRAASSGH